MNSPKVSIGIVLFGTKYLKESLPSLLASDYPNLEIILLDQEEGVWSAFDLIWDELPDIAANPRVKLSKGKNLWHSGGHNVCIQQALRQSSGQAPSDYYIAGSNDMLYASDCISKLVAALEESDAGFTAPRLLRWDFDTSTKTDYIDSCGLLATRAQRFTDRGQGRAWEDQFKKEPVFGASGALVCFKKSALEAIQFEQEYFDELIHYKNDVELSYRLNWAGQTCLFVPTAVAWHDRQLADRGFTARIKASRFEKTSSFVGHYILFLKNYSRDFSWQTRLATAIEMWKRFAFALLFAPYLVLEFAKLRRSRLDIQDKKTAMKRVTSPADMEALFN